MRQSRNEDVVAPREQPCADNPELQRRSGETMEQNEDARRALAVTHEDGAVVGRGHAIIATLTAGDEHDGLRVVSRYCERQRREPRRLARGEHGDQSESPPEMTPADMHSGKGGVLLTPC